jgi:magnesium chelatase subunit I
MVAQKGPFRKLATPDVTVADLIGDIDLIKAANLKLSYADDRVTDDSTC